jgi:TonB-linked SusC/RagA family outer membrane protein
MKFLLTTASIMLFVLSSWAQTRQITGQIIGAQKDTLAGAIVKQKGTNNGTATDYDGTFSLTIPDTGNVILQVSYAGYTQQEIAVGNQSTIKVNLEEDAKLMDEVVVVGYGTVKKSDLTGSVVSMKPEEITKVPTSNVMESIQGKVTGVDITRTSGSAGATPNVTIRGNRSITASNGPLYIVDGVQYSFIQDINSNDIQSMEVLKDASSTAIYGARGGNGVIIITTKRGVSNKPRVYLNAYTGFSQAEGFPTAMSASKFADLKRAAYAANHGGVAGTDAQVFTNANPDGTTELSYVQNGTNTNYVKDLIHNGLQQDVNVGFAGGTDKLKAYFSLDYYREKGVLKFDEMKRFTGRMNLDYQVNKILKVGTQTQFTHYDQSKRFNPMSKAFSVTPISPAYDANGNLILLPLNLAQPNPLADEQPNAFSNQVTTDRIFPTIYAEIAPLKGLTLRGNMMFSIDNIKDAAFYSANSVQQIPKAKTATSSIINKANTNKDWQFIATYNTKIQEKHSLTLTGLTEFIELKQDTSLASGSGQLVDQQLYYSLGANTTQQISSYYKKSNLISYAGRFNYGYKGRYLLTATGRIDGASQLAPGHQWDFFPSVAGAWRIAEENFMKNQRMFSEIKLRASYGVAGNYSVAPYSTQTVTKQVPASYDGANPVAAYAYSTQVGNPNLKWEKSGTVDIGLDIAIMQNRFVFSGDIYETNTNNLLLNRQLPPSSGVTYVIDNVGKTRNRGIELSLTTNNLQNKALAWSTTFTFMKNKEEVTQLTDNQNILNIGSATTPQYLVVGSPVTTYYDYEKVGIWQLGQESEAAKYGQKPGDVHLADLNGDGKITTADRKVVGTGVPKWSGGINNTLSFKGFDLSFYFYARMGQMINIRNAGNLYDPQGVNNSIEVGNSDFWTPTNPTNDLPSPNQGTAYSGVVGYSTLGYYDGSFIKLRSVNLSYTVPQKWSQKVGIQSAKVYVSGKNLWLLYSKIKNYDPEMGGTFSGPLVRLYTFGINLEF